MSRSMTDADLHRAMDQDEQNGEFQPVAYEWVDDSSAPAQQVDIRAVVEKMQRLHAAFVRRSKPQSTDAQQDAHDSEQRAWCLQHVDGAADLARAHPRTVAMLTTRRVACDPEQMDVVWFGVYQREQVEAGAITHAQGGANMAAYSMQKLRAQAERRS